MYGRIFVGEASVVWTDDGEVRSVPKDGGSVTVLSDRPGAALSGVTGSATHVYYATERVSRKLSEWPGDDAQVEPGHILKTPMIGGASNAIETGDHLSAEPLVVDAESIA